jgi:hypothetical protein
MKTLKSKATTIAIAIFLMLSMSASMLLVSNTSAHTPAWQIQLFAFINVAPNPAGLGQTVTLGFWLNAPPMTAGGPYGDRFGPFTVHVTKPDGTKQDLGPFYSDDTGGTSTAFVPDQLGTYSFQMTFPGQTLTGATNNPFKGGILSNANYVNDTLSPATSNIETLTVQQDPVPSVPISPLPTAYW